MKQILPTCFRALMCLPVFTFAFNHNASAQSLELVKDINQFNVALSSYPFNITTVGTKLFFIAAGNSNSYELWVSDGTTAGTAQVSTGTGPLTNISKITPYNGKVYFQYNDGVHGYEPWVSDGTAAGTVMLADINPGANGSYPEAFTVANSRLMFLAQNDIFQKRLYGTDGTEAGTILLKNTSIGLFNGFDNFAVMNNDIYFMSDNGTGSGSGMWKSDGTVAGTVLVKGDFQAGVFGSNYAVLNNQLYFSGYDPVNGGELWVTDGTTAGTNMVINLASDNGGTISSGQPNGMIVYNNKVYFSGTDDTHGPEFFVTDGTAGGTQLVKDIVPGSAGGNPSTPVIFNSLMYFSCNGAPELWKSDGTTGGTELVQTGILVPRMAGILNGLLYFVNNPGHTDEVWQTDGTTVGTTPIKLSNTTKPVTSLSADYHFEPFNGALYLAAGNDDLTVGIEFARITASVLPLKLISFTGIAHFDRDELNWITTDEVNTLRFDIQQSNDGAAFTTAGTVKASGSGHGDTKYQFSQLSRQNPGGYYRLQMMDKDGKSTFSKVIRLKRAVSEQLAMGYDQVGHQAVIRNTSGDELHWQLYSVNGALLKQGASSDSKILINLSGMSAGTFILKATTTAQTLTLKIIHQ